MSPRPLLVIFLLCSSTLRKQLKKGRIHLLTVQKVQFIMTACGSVSGVKSLQWLLTLYQLGSRDNLAGTRARIWPSLPCPSNPLPPVNLHFLKVQLSLKTVFAAEDKVFNHKSVGNISHSNRN